MVPMKELVITDYKDGMLYAVYEDKMMIQAAVYGRKETLLGNIYVGRIENIVTNINAAFIRITESVSCYLDISSAKDSVFVKKQSSKKISVGDELLVQVIKEDVKTKAPVVSGNFSLTGKYCVLVHHGTGVQVSKKITGKAVRDRLKELVTVPEQAAYGAVIRTNAQYVSEEKIQQEFLHLVKQYETLIAEGIHQTRFALLHKEPAPYMKELRDAEEFSFDQIITNLPEIYQNISDCLSVSPAFTKEKTPLQVYLKKTEELKAIYRIRHFMDRALQTMVYLPSGATLVIEPTEALTVIDVNTGKAIAGKKASEDTFYQINTEAAKEIAAQIRLRNISGIIIIDFINMYDEEHKEHLKKSLREHFKKDPVQTEIVEITKLGLMELTRKKVSKTLAEQIMELEKE